MKYENPDWTIRINIEWVPKDGKSSSITCPRCKGNRTEPMGPFSYYNEDEEETCKKCYGIGCIDNPEMSKEPEVPIELYDHIKKCFYEHLED